MPLSRPATSRKFQNNREIPPARHKEVSRRLVAPARRAVVLTKAKAWRRRNLQRRRMRPPHLFASIRVYSRFSLPTLPFALPWHFRAARQLFIINFNLHARHFTHPGWTNAVQPKLICQLFWPGSLALGEHTRPACRFRRPRRKLLLMLPFTNSMSHHACH
jgi:hypothetical protein